MSRPSIASVPLTSMTRCSKLKSPSPGTVNLIIAVHHMRNAGQASVGLPTRTDGIICHLNSLTIVEECMMTLNTFLAAWRFASLIANEEGPWLIFKRFRANAEQWCKSYRFCRELGLYELIACEWCNSIWIGVGLTLL